MEREEREGGEQRVVRDKFASRLKLCGRRFWSEQSSEIFQRLEAMS